jgi:hypothetical protein
VTLIKKAFPLQITCPSRSKTNPSLLSASISLSITPKNHIILAAFQGPEQIAEVIITSS